MKKTMLCVLMACSLMAAQAQQRKTPIMGWSSWNTYRVHISDTLILKQANAMVQSGLKEVGYTYINILLSAKTQNLAYAHTHTHTSLEK